MTSSTVKMPPSSKLWPLEKLKPYDKNPRIHTNDQIAQIAASITEFGFTNPILVADGEVVAGHGRLEAAKLLEMEQVPVIDVSHLSIAQRRAYVITDNQIALNAGWDLDLLLSELDELGEMGFDTEQLGFSDKEMKTFEETFKDPGTGATELSSEDYQNFEVHCPSCGFGFDAPKA